MKKKLCLVIFVALFFVVASTANVFAAVTACSTWPTALPQPAGAPSPPSGLVATPGDGQVVVTWNAVGGADGYYVFYPDCTGSAPGSIFDLPYETATTNSVTITGLTNGTTYQFKVSSYAGSGPGQTISTESTEVVEATPTNTVTTTTPTVTTTTVPPLPSLDDMSDYKFDVNGDGEVNSLDAALIIRYIQESGN